MRATLLPQQARPDSARARRKRRVQTAPPSPIRTRRGNPQSPSPCLLRAAGSMRGVIHGMSPSSRLGASWPPCLVRRVYGRLMKQRYNLLTHHRQLRQGLLTRTQGAHDKLRGSGVDVLLDPLGNVRRRPHRTAGGEGHIRTRTGDERCGLRDRLLPVG